MSTDLLRPASAVLPQNFRFWEHDTPARSPREIQQRYEQGFAGAWHDPDAKERFAEHLQRTGGSIDGAMLADANGLTNSGSGRLVIPHVFVEQLFPGVWPGAAQEVGDCVSHDTKNAALVTMSCDIVAAKPDEVSGSVEGVPTIDPVGIQNGGLSTEAIYWYRGYNGDGWSCEEAATIATSTSCLWLRNDYPDLGIDLRVYSGSLAHKYGARAPGAEITAAAKPHLMRTATNITGNYGLARDYLANGYGVGSCGGESFSAVRDANGMSPRTRKGWSHAYSIIGVDDRPETVAKYGEGLVLSINSWAAWNDGPRTIPGTTIDIPVGSWWCRWSEMKNRTLIAFSGANGWPAKSLPSFDLLVG